LIKVYGEVKALRREKAIYGIKSENVPEIELIKHSMEVMICWATKLNIINELTRKVSEIRIIDIKII